MGLGHASKQQTQLSVATTTLLLLFCGAAQAATTEACADVHGPVSNISYEGNKTTKEVTFNREVVIAVGDEASFEHIERSAQAIRDLGLFREVEATCTQEGDGVAVNFRVREKYYLIVAPRLDANSDGQYSYGAQARWYNAFGLNQTLRAKILKEERLEVGRGSAINFNATYTIPFLGDSAWGLRPGVSHVIQGVMSDAGDYEETADSFGMTVLRDLNFGEGPASVGSTLAVGAHWVNFSNSGEFAPEDPGSALLLGVGLSYNDIRFNHYSEVGWQGEISSNFAKKGWGSDFSQVGVDLDYASSWAVGTTPHQTVGLRVNAGTLAGGPDNGQFAYDVGGSNALRGFDLNQQIGDSYAQARLEFYRPIYRDWLRWGTFAEAGTAFRGPKNNDSGLLADVGLGLRARLTWFVNFELNLGIAVPVIGGSDNSGVKFYASGKP